MVHKLVGWSLDNPLLVLIASAVLIIGGVFAFLGVNVEAYPDPAPAIVEVIAQHPGASAEEVERQVTIPLEVALAGIPGLKSTRSKSLFGLSHLRNQFEYGVDYEKARQNVINRLQFVRGLPPSVDPQISPTSPTGEILRYTLDAPKDENGESIYSLNDLKTLQDWVLVRRLRRVPRIIDTVSSGGTVKRYEVRPDPERMMRYGITLRQLQDTIREGNANVGGDVIVHGENLLNVRSIGLIGYGRDPSQLPEVMLSEDPEAAAKVLRAEENARLKSIRELVVTSINNVPIRIEDLVEGGPLQYAEDMGRHKASKLATVRDARWKLHVLPPGEMNLRPGPEGRWDDPRAPDGVTILAPFEQYNLADHPGLTTGDAPAKMQLFDLQSDPGEQHDVAARHPAEVERLKTHFDRLNKEVPEVTEVKRAPYKIIR